MRMSPTACGATAAVAGAPAARWPSLQAAGADARRLRLVARVARQLRQVGRHLERRGLAGLALVVDLVARRNESTEAGSSGERRSATASVAADGCEIGSRMRSPARRAPAPSGAAFERRANGLSQSRPAVAQRLLDQRLAGSAQRHHRQAQRAAAQAHPRHRPLHGDRVRLAEQLPVQRQQLAAGSRTRAWPSPAIAATHSSCIRRGATLAVTLTLPWPPSSISATAVRVVAGIDREALRAPA